MLLSSKAHSFHLSAVLQVFFVVCKCPLLTAKYPASGTHRASNARGLPGGMLAAGIDSHINGRGGE